MKKSTEERSWFNLTARDTAFIAIFAAFLSIVAKVPGIPIIGVPGASIKFVAVLGPIYGLAIGPYFGFLAALIGGLIAAESPFDVLTSFCPATSALVAGSLTQKSLSSKSKASGWILAFAVLGLLTLGWYLTWVGQRAPSYPILHVTGLVLMLAMRGRIATMFSGDVVSGSSWRVRAHYLLAGIVIMVTAYTFTKPHLSFVWVFHYLSLPMFLAGGVMVVYSLLGVGKAPFILTVSLASYCGVVADHMLGNLIFINVIGVFIPLAEIEEHFLKPLGLPDIPALFMYTIPISAVERTLFTVVATIVGIGLINALRRADLWIRGP